jgi:hypothetical protein
LNKRTGELMPADHELIVALIKREVNEWGKGDGPPVQTITVAPGEKWPNVEEMNKKEPPEKWRKGPDGKMQGPFQRQRLV